MELSFEFTINVQTVVTQFNNSLQKLIQKFIRVLIEKLFVAALKIKKSFV